MEAPAMDGCVYPVAARAGGKQCVWTKVVSFPLSPGACLEASRAVERACLEASGGTGACSVPLVVFPVVFPVASLVASLVVLGGTAVCSEAWKECLETMRKMKVVGREMEAGGKGDEG